MVSGMERGALREKTEKRSIFGSHVSISRSPTTFSRWSSSGTSPTAWNFRMSATYARSVRSAYGGGTTFNYLL